jgi:hypothetical protein
MMVIIQRMNDSRYQILIEQMTVSLLVKITPATYEARRFIAPSCARGIQSVTTYTFLRFPLVLYFHLSSGLFYSPFESWNAFLISPYEFKVLFISYFLISSMSLLGKGTKIAALHHTASCEKRKQSHPQIYLSKCMLSCPKREKIT